MVAQICECFGLLINDGSVASIFCTFEDFGSHGRRMKFVRDECSKSDFLCWGCSEASVSAFLDLGMWELCFSLVSPLLESCYSLAFG